jgi:broad specificity phosphatase PhoE
MLLVAGVAYAVFSSATTTIVVLVRPPVEKQAGIISDPPLSTDGELHAQRLAQMFGEVTGAGRIKAIYVSDVRGAQQTAAPLAQRIHTEPIVVPGADAGDIADRVLDGHDGDSVLLVTGSELIPRLVLELSGIEIGPISATQPDNVYIVSIPTYGHANLLRFKY